MRHFLDFSKRVKKWFFQKSIKFRGFFRNPWTNFSVETFKYWRNNLVFVHILLFIPIHLMIMKIEKWNWNFEKIRILLRKNDFGFRDVGDCKIWKQTIGDAGDLIWKGLDGFWRNGVSSGFGKNLSFKCKLCITKWFLL